MEFFRDKFDAYYNNNRDKIFEKTKDDPEIAHENFIRTTKLIHWLKLERLLLDCSENSYVPGFEISNAGGLNKNGDIPPTFLKYLGFDRVVVGTVTGDEWDGNSRPRIKRIPETKSMYNWMNLPNVGAEKVARNLRCYGNHGIPITINFMSTPGKKGEEMLNDLENIISKTKDLPYVDRHELNISCPNPPQSGSKLMDTHEEYNNQLENMLRVTSENTRTKQKIWVKVSPDLKREDVTCIVNATRGFGKFEGFTVGNTTINHNEEKGGASGDAVYELSKKVQGWFYDEINRNGLSYKIIACGGIDSIERALERTNHGDKIINGIQIITPLVYEGPKLLRKLRRTNRPKFLDK